jgi:hypothetical protein
MRCCGPPSAVFLCMKLLGAQNQAVSGCGGKYFPAWSGKLLLPSSLQLQRHKLGTQKTQRVKSASGLPAASGTGAGKDPVVAPAGSDLRVWLTQALDFWARPSRSPFKGAGMGAVGWKAVAGQRYNYREKCFELSGSKG